MKKAQSEKFEAFYALVQSLHTTYVFATDAQKQFIETTVGAALFYLPSNKKQHFTGQFSEEALAGDENVQEHRYPRKYSARQLLTNPPASLDELIEVCNTMYLTYNITTKAENKRLVPYQKVDTFVSPEHSYKQAGIKLVTVE